MLGWVERIDSTTSAQLTEVKLKLEMVHDLSNAEFEFEASAFEKSLSLPVNSIESIARLDSVIVMFNGLIIKNWYQSIISVFFLSKCKNRAFSMCDFSKMALHVAQHRQ